jgi:hypothetical protein
MTTGAGRNLRRTVVALALVVGCASAQEAPVLSSSTLPDGAGATSAGTVRVGDRTFSFDGTCYDVGAGDALVVGAGVEADGATFDVLVQAFFGEPYVVVALADGTRFEPALDAPLDLFFDADLVRGTGIRFVTGLEPGSDTTGSPAGEGEVSVTCDGYVRGMPPGYDGVDDDGAEGN